MRKLEVRIVENQPAILLPPEIAERLQVGHGGEVLVDDTPSGLTLHEAADAAIVSTQVDCMNKVMDRRKDVLRRLAQ